jgi:hypothetical protein
MLTYNDHHLVKAKVINLQHLGFGYHKGETVAAWPDDNPYNDEPMWRVCRTDGCADRRLTIPQLRHSLEAVRTADSKVVYWSETESKRIAEHHWFDLTR